MGLYENQNQSHKEEQYEAIGYYRLSKDDGTDQTSDSIENQRALIHEYLKHHPNITLKEEAYDDGYSGTNFDRPGFRTVMEAITEGRVNCVIVKDLSRLGREYVETGKYLEMIFPSLGVRFIAINDDVDSINARSGDDILIPVKNIMNESYCRELSKKLRRQFKIQRMNGEFMGAFVCYGYRKDPADKHRLLIDPYPAEVVRTIYQLKLKGCNILSIANYLDGQNIMPPSIYKRSQGLNYRVPRENVRGKWNCMTLMKILKNPIYIGTLVQGIRGTPNYKVKKTVYRDKSEWAIVPNNHEPIIDEFTFQAVQRLMERDTQESGDAVLPLSGIVFCADCGHAMIRRNATAGKKVYQYLVCSNNKKNKICSSHSISLPHLEEVILRAIKTQIGLVVEMKQVLEELNGEDLISAKLRGLDARLAEQRAELDKQNTFSSRLSNALQEDLIDREEYDLMTNRTDAAIRTAQQAIRQLEQEREGILARGQQNLRWVDQFVRYQYEDTLTREMVVSLIDRVTVSTDKSIHIDFNFRDELAAYQEILTNISQEAS